MSVPFTVPKMKKVSRAEWLAYISQFPTRTSYRVGIVEPPQELCILDGEMIGRIHLMDGYSTPNEYYIRDDS